MSQIQQRAQRKVKRTSVFRRGPAGVLLCAGLLYGGLAHAREPLHSGRFSVAGDRESRSTPSPKREPIVNLPPRGSSSAHKSEIAESQTSAEETSQRVRFADLREDVDGPLASSR